MEPYYYIIAIIGGFLAGVVNTLAGNGSAITLTILTELLGLPGNVANGTNRVGIVFQTASAVVAFKRNDSLPIAKGKWIAIFMTIGAIIGVAVAINVTNEQFKTVFKYLMILMLFVVVVKPKRWFVEMDQPRNLPIWIIAIVYTCLGFYGGFIQMGMGIIYLAITVLFVRFKIIEANAIKNFIVGFYTLFVLAIFAYQGMVDWKIGGIIAIGQGTGGYLTAHYATRIPNADKYAYYLLVVVVILAVFSLFDIF